MDECRWYSGDSGAAAEHFDAGFSRFFLVYSRARRTYKLKGRGVSTPSVVDKRDRATASRRLQTRTVCGGFGQLN